MLIDPRRTWALLEARLKTEANTRVRRNIDVLIAHMKCEAVDDIDGVLKTLSPQAIYYNYDKPVGEPTVFRGHGEIIKFYDLLRATCRTLEFQVDQFSVDENLAVTAGTHKLAIYGAALERFSVPVDDPAALYFDTGRTVILWPFGVDGLIGGESLYRTSAYPFTEVAKHKLSATDIALSVP